MYAMTLPTFGDPDVLTWAEVDDPVPGPGEVLIEVAATAVNRADLLQRQGKYPAPPGSPAWPGLECSGRIIGLGAGVTGWHVGDEVCALLPGGGYAEKVVADAGLLLPVPGNVELADAAALPEVAATVWSNVFALAGLKAGEQFLVHGGASGIGTFAIQLAKAWGAKVAATASAAKHDALRALGADLTIDYRSEEFEDLVSADVILDIMGASYLERNIEALAPGGRLTMIGTQGGVKAEFDLRRLMAKRAWIAATTLRARPVENKREIIAEVREQVWPLVEAGKVLPVIDRRLPLTEAAEAHRVVEANAHVGKVLLTL
ncbi:NAD(P)H quinone oxidoreductase [Longispora fulva]|uniref:Putative PIG3 family NAD(P)H quinone oxidoreductase n=1 Tax=Longispora fulva TaxID=619741 RepID=A0A8J7KYX2_9ACTN|nr:NAD(P)H-quinone oxidoreductase [Longispora fulva]MBG6139787.1 putative PIG3 family NAD(P)H quinone oxidoreductase [Longispora fulva]GIG57829.1 NAD(P)H quinone oxidoreductase [Longispora fulva]